MSKSYGHWLQNAKRRRTPPRKKTGGTYDKAFKLRKPALEKSLDAVFAGRKDLDETFKGVA